MKRLVILLSVLSLGAFVGLFPVPSTSIASTEVAAGGDSLASSVVVHCPWLQSDGFISSELNLAASDRFNAAVSLPVAGEVLAERSGGGQPFGVVSTTDLLEGALTLAELAAVVEFSGDAGGGVVIGDGDGVLTSTNCVSTEPGVWQLAGGSTLTGMNLELRLFNPFPQDAVVSIRVTSENDLEPESTLESMSVRAQSTRVIDIGSLLDLRQLLALSISDPEGLVIPSFVQTVDDGDVAGWTGTQPSTQWDFPFTSSGATAGLLVLTNDQATQVSYDIDAFTPDGAVSQLWQGVLEPRTVIDLNIDELRALLPDPTIRPFGIRVRADAPIAAFLTGTGSGDMAAMAGLAEPATSWAVAGPGGAEANAIIWIMNPNQSQATVSFQRSSNDGGLLSAEKILIPPGSVVGISTVRGMILESDQPVSAAWIGSGVGATAYTEAIRLTPSASVRE